MQAAILSAKLPHLPDWNKARQEVAKIYDAGLNQIEDVVVPSIAVDRTHVYHLYTIKHPRRDALAAHPSAHGVQTAINYPTALPFLAPYSRLKHRPEQFPNAFDQQSKILSLPMFAEITARAAKRGNRPGSRFLTELSGLDRTGVRSKRQYGVFHPARLV